MLAGVQLLFAFLFILPLQQLVMVVTSFQKTVHLVRLRLGTPYLVGRLIKRRHEGCAVPKADSRRRRSRIASTATSSVSARTGTTKGRA